MIVVTKGRFKKTGFCIILIKMDSVKLAFDDTKLLEEYGNPDFAVAYGSGVFPQPGYSPYR